MRRVERDSRAAVITVLRARVVPCSFTRRNGRRRTGWRQRKDMIWPDVGVDNARTNVFQRRRQGCQSRRSILGRLSYPTTTPICDLVWLDQCFAPINFFFGKFESILQL